MRPFHSFCSLSVAIVACKSIFAFAAPESRVKVEVAPPSRTPPTPADVQMSIIGHTSEIPFTAQDIAIGYGFSKPPAHFKNENYLLKSSIVGTRKERSKGDSVCRKKPFSLSEQKYGCAFVALKNLIESEQQESQKRPKKKYKEAKPPKAADLREQSDWDALEAFGYRKLIPVFKVENIEEAKLLVSFAQKAKCKTPAASAALISQMESLLPESEAWTLIDATYATIADCTPFDSIFHESLHQRMGFLNILRQKNELAKESLNRALLATSPSEEYRTLFWRGFLESSHDSIPSTIKWNKFWERLTKDYPLTQHSVLAHGIFAEHPIATQLAKTPPRLSPHSGAEWDAINLTNFIYLNFVTQKDKRTAREFASKIEGKITPKELGPAMFLSASHRLSGNHRESMRVIYAAAKATGADALNPEVVRLLYPELYVKEVTQNAKGLDVPLVLSLMRQESSFNPNAESPRGARGLMQVLPTTAHAALKKKKKSPALNLKNPDINITAGCAYLKQQINRFNNNEITTLAAYNAGPTVATRWLERYKNAPPLLWADLIPYAETRSYVSGILRGRFWYRYLLGGASEQPNSAHELAYAERLLDMRLSPNLASREERSGFLSFLARKPQISATESEEPLYTEEF